MTCNTGGAVARPRAAAVCVVAALACRGAGGAPHEDALLAVLRFRDPAAVWSTLEQSPVAERFLSSPLAQRLGIEAHVTSIRRELARTEAELGAPLTSALESLAAGTGRLELWAVGSTVRFLLDLAPDRDVPFERIITRVVQAHPQFALAGREQRDRSVVLRVRAPRRLLFISVWAARLRVTDALQLLEPTAGGGAAASAVAASDGPWCLEIEAFPRIAGARLEPGKPSPPVESVRMTLDINAEGAALAGHAALSSPEMLEPFRRAAPGIPRLFARIPPGFLAAVSMRADLRALWEQMRDLAPAGDREKIDRWERGAALFFLGGRPLGQVLDGLGPELAVVVSAQDAAGVLPAVFSLLVEVRGDDARYALRHLGRVIWGISAVGSPEAAASSTPPEECFAWRLGHVPATFAVGEAGACLSTSEEMARAVAGLSGISAAPAASVLARDVPACHFLVGIDPAQLSLWLARHRDALAAQHGGGAAHRHEIETAAEFLKLLASAGLCAWAREDGVGFEARIGFAAGNAPDR